MLVQTRSLPINCTCISKLSKVCVYAVYDVTQKQTFDSVSDIWMQEVVRPDSASPHPMADLA